jgi:hypothetical protein
LVIGSLLLIRSVSVFSRRNVSAPWAHREPAPDGAVST